MSTFVIASFWLSWIFKFSLQNLLNQLNDLQILAHMPLNQVNIPSEAYLIFDLLLQIVTFDFFNPTDWFDFGFSGTDPYNESYSWLGYGSINIVECLGSILVF